MLCETCCINVIYWCNVDGCIEGKLQYYEIFHLCTFEAIVVRTHVKLWQQ